MNANGHATNLRQPVVVYNPVTHGYVVALESEAFHGIEILCAYLSSSGDLQSGGPVFSFSVDVLQPNLVYDPVTRTFIFVSQLDSSYGGLPSGKNGLLIRSEPASAKSTGRRSASLVGYTSVKKSSVSMHRDTGTQCLRVCYINDPDARGLTVPTCSKVCHDGHQQWNTRHHDVKFCSCKMTVTNPFVIEYPVNGAVFGVWEEADKTRHRLHGYYVNTQNFLQNPLATTQKHPLAVYKPNDGQVCVVWQYRSLSTGNTRNKLAFRCYKLSRSCNDPCCCQYGRHCGKKCVLVRLLD